MISRNSAALSFLLGALLLTGCTAQRQAEPEPTPRLSPVDFSALPQWRQDDHSALRPALARSCDLWLKRPPARALALANGPGRSVADMHAACRALPAETATPDAMRRYIETHFTPFAVTDGDDADGLFTGYFEPLLSGTRRRVSPDQVPLYRRPPDLVSADLGLFRPDWRGERLAGRVENGRLLPYADRAAINGGALDGRGLELVYADDPIAAFFLQIQGSGIVALPDGERLRVGYDGQNGHRYVPIGRVLIERGALTRETVSMQSIAAWLRANPDQAEAVMEANPSFVFFAPRTGPGPLGAEGTALTPGRSLAVDRRFWPLGLPLWLDVEDPRGPNDRLRRIVMAQDIGGAIRGVVRGDLFWGDGAAAEAAAGAMRSAGRYWLLLPRRAADVAQR